MYLLVPFRPVGIQCFHLTIVIAGLDAYFTSLSNGFNNIKQFSVTECSMIRTLVTTWAQQCSNSWLFFSDLQQVLFTVCVCVCVCVCARARVHVCALSCFSHVRLFATLWTVAHQASLSMGFFKQEYWSGLPWPSPGDLPDPGIEPASPTYLSLVDRFFTTSSST